MSCRSPCIPTTSPSTSAPTFSRTMLPFHDSATCSLWIRLAGPRMPVVHRVSLVNVHCCLPRPRLSSNPQPSSPSFPPRPLALRLIGRSVGSSGRGPSLPAVSTRSPDGLVWSVEPPSLCGGRAMRSACLHSSSSPGLQVGPCLVSTPYAFIVGRRSGPPPFSTPTCQSPGIRIWGTRERKERFELALADRSFNHRISQQSKGLSNHA